MALVIPERIMHTYLKQALAAALLLGTALSTPAAVITFSGGADPAFTYDGGIYTINSNILPPASGYASVGAFTGEPNVAFNSSGVSPSSFYLAGAASSVFTLNSFVIAGAWGAQTLAIKGYNNGALLFSSMLPVTPVAKLALFGWAGIDQLTIFTGTDFVESNNGGAGLHWALDNLTINQALAANPVSEPAPLALLGLALIVLALSCRIAPANGRASEQPV